MQNHAQNAADFHKIWWKGGTWPMKETTSHTLMMPKNMQTKN